MEKEKRDLELINSHVNPSHYKQGKYEVIDILKDQLSKEELKGFCKANILKYLLRADYKNGFEDYSKAAWYLNYLLKTLEEDNK